MGKRYIQDNLFAMETVKLSEIAEFIAKTMQGYGNETAYEIKGTFIHSTYVIGAFLTYGTKDEREAVHNSFCIDINQDEKGKVSNLCLDGFHSFESGNWELEFIRKLDRCRCFDEYAIDMEGKQKNGNENGRKQDEMRKPKEV